MKKKNQKGFTLVEVLLLILVLAAVCGVGLYAYNTVHNKSETKDGSTTATSSTPAPSPAKASTEDNMFTFKELDAKIPLSTDLKDLSYSADEQYPTLFNVTTTNFKSTDHTCAGFFAQLAKGDGTFKESQSGLLLKQFNGFYVEANIPQCVEDSPYATSLLNALEAAFKEAQPVN